MNFARCSRLIASDTAVSGLVWCAVLMLLVAIVPLFLSSPLNSDAIYYDLQAKCVADGGVLYRDMLEPNLPGAVWIHAAVRTLGGESSVTLRLFDLFAFSLVAVLLAIRDWGFQPQHVPSELRQDAPATHRAPTLIFACCLFYLPLTSWSQCQRDLWMLLPGLVALCFRLTTVRALRSDSQQRVTALSIVEGSCWGAAFWIKPHIALPAIAVLAASIMLTGWSRRVIASVGLVLAGGVLIGVAGSLWLIASGAWPHFWDTQLHWNTEYLAARGHSDIFEQLGELLGSFAPWSWLHLVALPMATWTLATKFASIVQLPNALIGGRRRSSPCQPTPNDRDMLIMALYVGWMLQIILLQHTFAYVQVPGILLAIAVVVSWPCPAHWVVTRRAVTGAFFCLAIYGSNITSTTRLDAWHECVAGKGLAADTAIRLRAKLEDRPDQLWEEYPAVVDFLRTQNVREQDVFVYHWSQLCLYSDLGLMPPHRYVIADSHEVLFPSQATRMRNAIDRSPYRFVVTDLGSIGVTAKQADRLVGKSSLPTLLPTSASTRFPFNLPIVFRSGTLCVHERAGTNTATAQTTNLLQHESLAAGHSL